MMPMPPRCLGSAFPRALAVSCIGWRILALPPSPRLAMGSLATTDRVSRLRVGWKTLRVAGRHYVHGALKREPGAAHERTTARFPDRGAGCDRARALRRRAVGRPRR